MLSPKWTPLCFFGILFLVSVCITACSGSNDEGVEASRVETALQVHGFTLTASSGDARIARPLLYLGGALGESVAPSELLRTASCLEEAPDSVFSLSLEGADGFRPVSEVVENVRAALGELKALGYKDVVVFGFNTGGLYARAALVTEAPAIPVKLVTLAAPFAGIRTSTTDSPYPAEFFFGSDFIESPGALASGVEHYKYGLSFSGDTPLLALRGDKIHPDSQTNTAVESDAAVVQNTRVPILFGPIGIQALVRQIFESLDALSSSLLPW